ncbi:MAG: glutamine--tRNA ligase/YqeY domain fusion protein [Burkholderiales bacterium]|nr:glutamine--tRNA ligase/YqeY domain fusion protein [Burkholderiales bacterium]
MSSKPTHEDRASASGEGHAQPAAVSNFLRAVIENDLRAGRYAARRWGGTPGPAATHAGAAPDPWPVRTRFPPEPNGYLHFGHAKSICLNFGLARDYGGVCHMRFDDTNPTKEEQEYVDSILDAVRWLGFDWGKHLYYASDYFRTLYEFAEAFIEHGYAYVDSQSAEAMRASRGTLTEPGCDSPYRERSAQESLDLFRRMKAGEFADGTHVLRLKIDMASANINLRDPAIYRIRHAHHHRTGDAWCVYPLYDYAHCISDALENITHSICTLEFENNRALYDWIVEKLADFGLLAHPLPRQYEFARLNLTYVVLSKRKLIQLVEDKHVEGWDDPRMPTLVGARRRGYTPEGFRAFAERIGVSKADSSIDLSVLEECMREHLNESAPRRIAVLDPLKLVIDNYPEDAEENCEAPNHPQKPEWGRRALPFSRELWIEREDFAEQPPKGYFRLFPGNRVRLRYGYVVECTGCDKDAAGNIMTVRCSYFPDSKSGTPGANAYKVKGNIHWLSARHAYAAPIRLYDRLFKTPHPGAAEDFVAELNPDSMRQSSAQVEPALREAQPEARFQFERHGYFVADRVDSRAGAPVFNRAVGLKDSWRG